MALGSTLYGLPGVRTRPLQRVDPAGAGFATSAYHSALAVTAITGPAGNFLGGGLMDRVGPRRLMAASLGLAGPGLAWIPTCNRRRSFWPGRVDGDRGGGVSVLFFSIWRRVYGRRELGASRAPPRC